MRLLRQHGGTALILSSAALVALHEPSRPALPFVLALAGAALLLSLVALVAERIWLAPAERALAAAEARLQRTRAADAAADLRLAAARAAERAR